MDEPRSPAAREAGLDRKHAEETIRALYNIGGATLDHLEEPARQFLERLGEDANGPFKTLREAGCGHAETVLWLAAGAAAYAFEEKRAKGRLKESDGPWEIIQGMPRKRFRGLRGRLEKAAEGEVKGTKIRELANDLREVHASLSSPGELYGKTTADLGYPDLVRLAEDLERTPDASTLVNPLRGARDFIEKEGLSNEGLNSPERLAVATAIERALVDSVRRSTVTAEPHFGEVAALLELVEKRVGVDASRQRFGPDTDNAENLRKRIAGLAESGCGPVPAIRVFALGKRFLEENFNPSK